MDANTTPASPATSIVPNIGLPNSVRPRMFMTMIVAITMSASVASTRSAFHRYP